MKRLLIALPVLGCLAVTDARAAPVSRDDFLATTTGNLVTLCSAAPTDPMYTPAMNFCHGFTVGTYRVIATEEAASRVKKKMFCPPESMPNRDQSIAAFVQWASARPSTLASSPTDGIVEYLASQFPCK